MARLLWYRPDSEQPCLGVRLVIMRSDRLISAYTLLENSHFLK